MIYSIYYGGIQRDLVNGGLLNSINAIKVPSKKRKSTAQDVSFRKCKHISNDEFSKIKGKAHTYLDNICELEFTG